MNLTLILNVLQSCPDFEYVEFYGESVVSFDIAKDIQERILDALEDAGVELVYEQQQTKDSGMVMGGM